MAYINEGEALSRLRTGDRAVVVGVAPSPLSPRLHELGIVAGGEVSCVGRSPFGGMGAYDVMGCVVAVRDLDAERVRCRRISAD